MVGWPWYGMAWHRSSKNRMFVCLAWCSLFYFISNTVFGFFCSKCKQHAHTLNILTFSDAQVFKGKGYFGFNENEKSTTNKHKHIIKDDWNLHYTTQISYFICHYNSLVRVTTHLLTPSMLCVFILFMSDRTYNVYFTLTVFARRGC